MASTYPLLGPRLHLPRLMDGLVDPISCKESLAMQFGRIDETGFSFDAAWPLSPMQAGSCQNARTPRFGPTCLTQRVG